MANQSSTRLPLSEAPFLQSTVFSVVVVVGAFLLGILGGFVGIQVLFAAGLAESSESISVQVLASVLQFAGFIVAGALFVAWYREYTDSDLLGLDFPGAMDVLWGVVGFFALLIGVLAISAILTALDLAPATNSVVEAGQQNPTFFLYMIPITILLVGPGEELLFRGIVQGLFRRVVGPIPAILIASAAFGIVHVVAVTGTGSSIAVYVAVAAVLGVVLGSLYEVTENLVVPAVVHGSYNALLFSVQYLVATGEVALPSEAATLLVLV